MKIYISGPVTGTDDYIDRFYAAQMDLTKAGHIVINPAAVNTMLPAGTTYEEYMKMSFCMLEMCEAIYMLNGWQKSKGARAELEVAKVTGKKILFECGKSEYAESTAISDAFRRKFMEIVSLTNISVPKLHDEDLLLREK